MVWSRGPWHFDKCLLMLEKPSGSGEISKMLFQKVDFCILIYNVPILCMNRRIVKKISKMVGEIVECPVESRECWGKFMRLKVRVDISKPLVRGIRVWLEEFETIVIALLRYERLPEFCYVCGMVSHC
ncbi:hypothetical protein ACOSQ3_006996 [Xanthoceras sorbifolium]